MDEEYRARGDRRRWLAKPLAAPLIVGGLGAAMLTVALGQDAFVGGRIGPGLFAQVFAGSVIALAGLWIGLAALATPASAGQSLSLPILPGLCLIGAVVVFIFARPVFGLVPTAAIVAVLASVGAGDGGVRALFLSALVGGVVAWIIGQLLLPPTTALWPWHPHL